MDIENIHDENGQDSDERRLKKRCNAVNSIKAKDEYKILERLRSEGVTEDIPLTPDPHSIEDTSKRTWEKKVQVWREKLRDLSSREKQPQ